MTGKLAKAVRNFHLEGVAGHIGTLFSANVVVAVLGLGTVIVTARALGPAGVGLLALIEAYARLVNQVVRVEPSQALIKYGSEALEAGDTARFFRLVKLSTLIDIVGALCACAVAWACLSLARDWFGFDPEQTRFAGYFLMAIPFFVSATPIALLRLLQRIKLYARLLVGMAALRLAVTTALWLAGADFAVFLGFLIAYTIVENLVPVVLGWRVLRAQYPQAGLSHPLSGVLRENPKLPRFIFSANANVLARNSTRQLDTVVLGGLVGVSDIGNYQIAKRIGLAALRLARPVQFVVFPKLSQLWARGETRRLTALTLRLNGLLGLLGLVAVGLVWLVGDTAIRLLFGPDFAGAVPLLVLHMAAAGCLLFGAVLNPALLSIGQDKALLGITLLATAIFFAGLGPLVSQYGIIAASALHVVFNLVWSAGCLWVFLRTAGHLRG